MIDTFIAHFGEILPFILIGFGAQIIDGALGMASNRVLEITP